MTDETPNGETTPLTIWPELNPLAGAPQAGYTKETWVTVTLVPSAEETTGGEEITMVPTDPRIWGGDLTAAALDATERANRTPGGAAAVYNLEDRIGVQFERDAKDTMRVTPTQRRKGEYEFVGPAETMRRHDGSRILAAVANHPAIQDYRPVRLESAKRKTWGEWLGLKP